MARRENSITKADFVIAVSVLIVAVAMLFYTNIVMVSKNAKSVEIEVDGEIYAKYELNSIFGKKAVEIDTVFGYNIVEIECDSVGVVEASCSDKLCLGEISKAGEVLVCLPSRLVVRLLGDTDVDAVAY